MLIKRNSFLLCVAGRFTETPPALPPRLVFSHLDSFIAEQEAVSHISLEGLHMAAESPAKPTPTKSPGGSRRSLLGLGKSAKKLEVKNEERDEIVERRKSISMVQQAAAQEQERLVDEGECTPCSCVTLLF